MANLDWLIARPVAHRGLHDAAAGIIENTPSAFAAAIAANYAIECDLQISADGEAMVYHDDELGRLTDGRGALATITAAELKRVSFYGCTDRMITADELLELVNRRVTLVVELKSRFEGDSRLVERVAKVFERHSGPVSLMSFDPAQVAALRALAPSLTRGLVAERTYRDHERNELTAATKRAMSYFTHAARTRPQFLAYGVKDLPAALPFLAKRLFGLPVLTWTVRTEDDRRRAARYADQMIFEGFRP
jgi:glycerophosphoryl diester phosphodiesterase